MITKHSELSKLLADAGLESAALISPPKAYIATLLDETDGKASTVLFYDRQTTENVLGAPLVVRKLMEMSYPDIKLAHAELADSTMEWFLEQHAPAYNSRVVVPGPEIRYVLEPEERQSGRRKTKYVVRAWWYLPENIKLIIVSHDPFVVDGDLYTLRQNLVMAEAVLQKRIGIIDEQIIESQTMKAAAESALSTIQKAKACK